MDILEKILPSLVVFLTSCILSGVVTVVTLKVAFRQQAADFTLFKVEVKEENKLLHDRISKKDVERLDDMKEIRMDVKQMLTNQAHISGFIDGLKSGDRRQHT